METSINAGPVITAQAAGEKRERIQGALAHLRAHGNLDAFAASQSEKIAIVTIARRDGLVVPRRDWGYRVTSRGRRYCAGPQPRKTWVAGLATCLAGVATLAALSYGNVQLRTPPVSSTAITVLEPAAPPAASLPAATVLAAHEVEPLELVPLRAVETTGSAPAAEPHVAPAPEATREHAPAKKDVKRHRSTSRSRIGMPAGARNWQRWTGSYRQPTLF